MSEALVLQAPNKPAALFLLFHGVGASQHDLAPLGERLAHAFPDAAVVSVPAPDASDLGRHFLHGSADPVIPAAHAQAALRRLQELNADVTLDVLPGLGHGIDRAAEDLLLQHLRAA